MEDCKLKNSAFIIENDFTIIPNIGKFYQQIIDCTVELKACILILGENQLWRNDPFQDKSESWTSGNDNWWNLEEETTDDDEPLGIQTFAYIKKDGNIH